MLACPFDLLRRAHTDDMGEEQTLALYFSAFAQGEHLLKQDALVRYMLIDDPQPVAPRRDDKAIVNLPQGTEVAQGF